MELKNIVEEVNELYNLLLITDKHFKNNKLHGKQLKSILDIIQIKQNDIINYVLDKNGKQPKKIKTLRGGYNKKILKEELDINIDDESIISSEYENIINSLMKENRRLEINNKIENDDEILSLKSVVSSDDLNEVKNYNIELQIKNILDINDKN